MADSAEVSADPVQKLVKALGSFIRAADTVHWYWEHWGRSVKWPENFDDNTARVITEAPLIHAENRKKMFSARDDLADARDQLMLLYSAAVGVVVPPLGQDRVQYVAWIQETVEQVWHYCRFVRSMDPGKPEEHPGLRPDWDGLMNEVPILRRRLWEAWRHLGNSADLRSSAAELAATDEYTEPPEVEDPDDENLDADDLDEDEDLEDDLDDDDEISPPTDSVGMTTHGDDFRAVVWFDKRYSFTKNQAPAVKLLWEAWESGVLDVGDETLLMAVDHEAPRARLSTLFRGHRAWGKMIVQGETKGSHRLRQLD